MTLTGSSNTAAAAADARRTCRIVLIDKQRIFRQALRILIEAEGGYTVVGDAGEHAEALALIEAERPDVVISELHLREDTGVQHVAEIHSRYPQLGILVLTAARGRDVAARVRRAGALGYLLKDEGRGELLGALREVAAGRRYRNGGPAVGARRSPPLKSSLSTRALYLTARQRQVLRSLALGYGTRDIAQMLGVSVKAVHMQRERLRNALQLNSTAALTRFAVCEGLTEDSPPSR